MEKQGPLDINLNDVEATMLLTLYCRARESSSVNPLLNDTRAIEITMQLNPVLQASSNRLYRELAAGKVNKYMSVYLSMRARRFDRYTRDFLQKSPSGTVVEMALLLHESHVFRNWRKPG